MKQTKLVFFLALTIALVVATLGCTTSGQYSSKQSTMTDEEVQAAVATLLARADLADETEDHVVEQCAGCGLAMPGSPDHTLQVQDYEMHFCSDDCYGHFADDPDEAILALGELETAEDPTN